MHGSAYLILPPPEPQTIWRDRGEEREEKGMAQARSLVEWLGRSHIGWLVHWLVRWVSTARSLVARGRRG